ncbi:MAG: hypothetical protein E6G01_12625 [Actinobacteria bacterium]|nr:MAG: hypothetical protein E6G01_12625 [Actinomycetota bacterium]
MSKGLPRRRVWPRPRSTGATATRPTWPRRPSPPWSRWTSSPDRRTIHGAISLLADAGEAEFLELHRRRIIRPRQQRSQQLLRRAQELGLIRPDADLDLVMEMLIGSFFARHLAGRKRPRRWAETAVATLWKGLETRP